MNGLINWQKDQAQNFGQTCQLFHHTFADHQDLKDEALAHLIDAYPYEGVEVFTMGHDPIKTKEWYFGRRGDHDGKALMAAVKAGRIWINLRKANRVSPKIDALMKALFAEIEEKTGKKTFKPDMGLLISSPRAQVFYHLDMPLVMLYQIRGEKKVYLYPPTAPFIDPLSLEGLALGINDEQLPYEPQWDGDAFIHVLKPGEMLSWPQNAPHRIVNEDCVNVSLSVEYLTTKALLRANALYTNGLLRKMGLKPSLRSHAVGDVVKFALARAHKALKHKKQKSPLKPAFSLAKHDASQIEFDPVT